MSRLNHDCKMVDITVTMVPEAKSLDFNKVCSLFELSTKTAQCITIMCLKN